MFQANYTNSVLWRCRVRNKATRCPATVRQIGDRFEARSAEHVHPADPGRRLKAEVTAKVRMFLVY